jgi:hypothetical protein
MVRKYIERYFSSMSVVSARALIVVGAAKHRSRQPAALEILASLLLMFVASVFVECRVTNILFKRKGGLLHGRTKNVLPLEDESYMLLEGCCKYK